LDRMADTGTADTFLFSISVDGTVQWTASGPANFLDDKIATWIMVVLAMDGTEAVLKVNGQSVALTFPVSTDKTKWFTDIINAVSPVDNFTLSGRNRNGSLALPFDGLLDNVIITSDVWSTNEALNHYRAENDPDAFYVFGAPEDQPEVPAPVVDTGVFYPLFATSRLIMGPIMGL